MKRSGLGTRGWGLTVALAALTFGGILAQTPAPQPPTFRTEANYVRVDIYPTHDDKPVTDLTQADFEILEGGVPQKIKQFERGNKEVPTADLRFRRNEQVRVEIPTRSTDPVTARLLDRTGKPLAVPVTAAVRDDADGSRWVTAQLALSPLAPADYAIEISSGDRRMISAFRVVP
jgi:hypothetical protein